jgi:hypothetical protein
MIQKTYTDCGCEITVYGDGSAPPDVEYCDMHSPQLAPVNPLSRTHPLCEMPVKIRLEGLTKDVATIAQLLRETGCVVEESPDYPNRGASKFVRRYVTVKL